MRKYLVIFRDGNKDVVYSLIVQALSFKDASKRELVISLCNNPQFDNIESLLIINMDFGTYKIFEV